MGGKKVESIYLSIILKYYKEEGPRNILTGSFNKALINSNTPSTAIPRNRKGKSNNQSIGYIINAAIAKGQQRINKISQRINFAKTLSPIKLLS
jgi:hypothetical protein